MLPNARSIVVFSRFVGEWWREPVDYLGQVQYFAKRAMSGAIQKLIGLGTGLNAVISLALLLPYADTGAAQVAIVMFAALQFFWAWNWCCQPWPARRTSLAFVISADIGIAAVAVIDASWLLGLFGFNAFAMISVYLMFFDGPKVLAGHVIWILVSTTAFALRAAADAGFDRAAFTASTLAAVVPVVATPLGIQLGIWALRNDANESVTDPLTGLLNRRGLQLHFGDMLQDAGRNAEAVVVVVDLDRFKDVNDSFGHTIGDQVLARSARRIKSAVRGSALVARVGGEEFVIVDLEETGRDARRDFDRVRRALAAPADPPITASVGVTSIAVAELVPTGADPVVLLDAVIERADQAMFTAKRNGGNATVYRKSRPA
jgi:diguanylate cyclase (GGDEF)-like protein